MHAVSRKVRVPRIAHTPVRLCFEFLSYDFSVSNICPTLVFEYYSQAICFGIAEPQSEGHGTSYWHFLANHDFPGNSVLSSCKSLEWSSLGNPDFLEALNKQDVPKSFLEKHNSHFGRCGEHRTFRIFISILYSPTLTFYQISSKYIQILHFGSPDVF